MGDKAAQKGAQAQETPSACAACAALQARLVAVEALLAQARAALAWALGALGDPPEFTGLLADWEAARAVLAAAPAPGPAEEVRDGE